MYTIISRERRITGYVKKQACKWLYKRIEAGEYEGHSNDSVSFLLKIRKDKALDQAAYDSFVSQFCNDPYYYMLTHDRIKNTDRITACHIDNYFISFNGVSLPVGFVKTFFEDDYETQEEIRAFYRLYLNETLNEFFINSELQKNNIEKQIEQIEEGNYSLLHPKVRYHIENLLIRMLLSVIGFTVCSHCFWEAVELWLELNRTVTHTATFVFTEELALDLAIYGAATLAMLAPAIKAVKLLIFYIKWLRIKVYALQLGHSLNRFVSSTMVRFKEHFEEINAYLMSSPRIVEDPCLRAPENKRHYLYITNFDQNGFIQKLEKLKKKYKFQVNILGADGKWFAGLFAYIFWIAVAYVWGTPGLWEEIVAAITDVLNTAP